MQALIAAISSDTLDTGDMMTVRDGALYVCELKSQVNTTNSASFPQELRELKDKCETQRRFRRASNQQVLPAFCVLRHNKAIDEIRTYQPDERDQANRDIAGFQYRYLTGAGFLAMAYRLRLRRRSYRRRSRIEIATSAKRVKSASTACRKRCAEPSRKTPLATP